MTVVSSIIALACEAAHSPGKTQQAAELLSTILADLAETYDFADARGLYTFNFNPGLTSNFGSGPYPLPLDYLRTSGSSGSTGSNKSVWWMLQGVPYPMVPIDLSEFDMQVMQAGIQSYPYLFATDMSRQGFGFDVGLAGSILVNTVQGGLTISGLPNPPAAAGVAAGMSAGGAGIAPGSIITGVSSTSVTLSLPMTATLSQVFLNYGVAPVGYAWPPPSGAFPVFVRYQRRMPQISFAGSTFGFGGTIVAAPPVPWFRNIEYLITRLTGELCKLNDDERWMQMLGDGPHGAQGILKRYLKLKDDDTNRAKTVQLDRRTFGQKFNLLPNTKAIGW